MYVLLRGVEYVGLLLFLNGLWVRGSMCLSVCDEYGGDGGVGLCSRRDKRMLGRWGMKVPLLVNGVGSRYR